MKQSVFNLGGISFGILDKTINQIKYKTNYVIIGKVDFVSNQNLSIWKQHKTTLILHPKCTYKTKKFIKNNYPLDLIYDIKEEGAFIFSF